MKKRIAALLTTLLLALSLCVPAMAETDYGFVYDETEMLCTEDLAKLGETTLPDLAEDLGLELRVDVLTGNSYGSLNDAAAGIYERFGYGYGSEHEGATLTVLMELQDDGTYLMPESDGWCVYALLSAERGSSQALADALYAAAAPYMDDSSVWRSGDMDEAAQMLSWAVHDFASAAIDFVYDSEPDDPGDTLEWDDGDDADTLEASYVFDTCDLLSQEEWEELEMRAKRISERHGCGVYAAFVDDFTEYGDGGDVYKTTYQLYHASELGMGENRDGIIILLSMDERDYAMFVYGKSAEHAFNKYGQEQLEGYFLGDFGRNDWYGGVSHYLDGCDEYLTLAEEGNPVRKNPLPLYLIVVAASFVISGFICIMLKWKMQTVHKKAEANEYVAADGLQLTKQYDRYTHTTETRHRIRDDSDSGTSSCSGGGGSGRSGKF